MPRIPHRLTGLAATLACLAAAPAHAGEVEHMLDVMFSEICMIQNWDTPKMQGWLGKLSRQQRMQIYGGFTRFTAEEKRCFMESKAVPVDLCNKVIVLMDDYRRRTGVVGSDESFLALSSEDSNRLDEGIGKGMEKCLADDEKKLTAGETDWLPKDLQPTRATRELLVRAGKGDLSAQLAAVKLFKDGQDMPPNPVKAMYWQQRAAESGDVESQVIVAEDYRYGRTLRTDPQEALRWMKKAAEQGHRLAQRHLGDMLAEGEAGRDDAILWYKKAAAQGDGESAYDLARLYAERKDETNRLEWLKKSAALSFTRAMLELAKLLDTDSASPEARAEAQTLRRKSALMCGSMHELKDYSPWSGRPADEKELLRMQEEHASQGDVNAQLAVAIRYYWGYGADKNETAGVLWWRKAAQAGDPIAQSQLGRALSNGFGVEKNPAEGLAWYQKAAAQDNPEAEQSIAEWYIQTEGKTPEEDDRNWQTGIEWLKKAVAHGCEGSEEWLRRLLRK